MRKRADFHLVSHHERTWLSIDEEEKRMTATTYADASSRSSFNWHDINWRQTIQTVRRLQVRIVKATQAGDWRKVRSLQRLLTHSFSAKLLAVKRVSENRGKRTAGVDGELWETPAKKVRAVERLATRRYRTQPLRRVYILKSDGKRVSSGGIST
jgi:RNA-directed DNA polymerase